MSDIEDVSTALSKWAFAEMGFQKSDSKDSCDIRKTVDLSGICLGPLADVWSYIIKHVKSEPTVQVIKGNLKLHSPKQILDDNSLALVQERHKLQQEVHDLARTTNVLKDSLMEARLSLWEKERQLVQQQLAFRDVERSCFMLHWISDQVQFEIKKINHTIGKLEKDLLSFSPPASNEKDRDPIAIELMCQEMQHCFDELLKEDPQVAGIQEIKSNVKQSLAALMETVPRSSLMSLLHKQQETDLVNLTKIEKSSLPVNQLPNNPDLNLKPEDVHPLQKLLNELSWFYVDSRSRAESASKQIAIVKQELKQLESTFNQQLIMKPSAGDENVREAVAQLAQFEIQLARRKAVVDTLQKTVDELEMFCFSFEASQADIEQKIATIKRNGKRADMLSSIICTLARKHEDNRQAVQQTISRLQRLAGEDVKTACDQLSNNIKLANGSMLKELELFRRLKPHLLFNTFVENKPMLVERLAIHRFQPSATEASYLASQLKTTLSILGPHRQASVCEIFRAIGEKQSRMRSMRNALRWHETRRFEMSEQYGQAWLMNCLTHFRSLAKELENQRNSKMKAILPSLEQRIKTMEEASSHTEEVEIALNEWCEEPARLIDTGRVVNGHSLEYWRHQWNTSLSLCRKK